MSLGKARRSSWGSDRYRRRDLRQSAHSLRACPGDPPEDGRTPAAPTHSFGTLGTDQHRLDRRAPRDQGGTQCSYVCRHIKRPSFIPTSQHANAVGIAQISVPEVLRLHGVPTATISDHTPVSSAKRGVSCADTGYRAGDVHSLPPPDQRPGGDDKPEDRADAASRPASDRSQWAQLLSHLEFAYNSAQHSSTKRVPT